MPNGAALATSSSLGIRSSKRTPGGKAPPSSAPGQTTDDFRHGDLHPKMGWYHRTICVCLRSLCISICRSCVFFTRWKLVVNPLVFEDLIHNILLGCSSTKFEIWTAKMRAWQWEIPSFTGKGLCGFIQLVGSPASLAWLVVLMPSVGAGVYIITFNQCQGDFCTEQLVHPRVMYT